MDENRRILKEIKPWIILAAIVMVFFTIAINITSVYSWIKSVILILTPLYYGFAFAFVLNIPMKRIEKFIKEKIPYFADKNYVRTLAIVLSIILMFVVISVIIVTVVPQLYESIMGLINNIATYAANIETFINAILQELDIEKVINLDGVFNIPWSELINNIKNIIEPSMTSILNNTMAFTVVLGNIFMGLMLSIYLLNGKEIFIRQSKMLVRAIFGIKIGATIINIGKRANDVFENFIGGQLVECCILAIIFYIGLSLFKMPYTLLIAIITGVSGIIPIFGAMLAMLFGALLIFAINPMQAVGFIILYQCLQQFENNVVYPRIVGNSVGLQGIWVLLSIIIFGELFGGIGMVLAVPTMAVVYGLISELVHFRLKSLEQTEIREKVE